ncbi:hypothetical protein K9M74_04440 [Candidatus Woesearchaeota archaeon]|nr:hypothetical protein [Candidatus Woesearchaeota archaeon]
MELDKERAKDVLIKPFKEQGMLFLEQFSRLAYQKDLLDPLKEHETPERLALLSFLAVLYDSQKESRKHYKEVLELYRANPDFFTLENILAMNSEEAGFFARSDMLSMAKKGDYMQTSYRKIQDEYGGQMLNVLDEDIVETQKRLLTFKGIGDGLSGLYVHTVRDHGIFSFRNEEEFCPKIDFHDYNIGRALGIVQDINQRIPGENKKLFGKFLRDLAQEEDISIFDLDAFLWGIGQICTAKNDAHCQELCPLASQYQFPRAYRFENDYFVRGKKAQSRKKIAEAMQYQGKLF